MVYVDDFKAAGTPNALNKAWSLIKSGLDLDEPGDVGRCLGCHHRLADAVVNGKKVKVMEYVVEEFMTSCVDAYKKACDDPNLKL